MAGVPARTLAAARAAAPRISAILPRPPRTVSSSRAEAAVRTTIASLLAVLEALLPVAPVCWAPAATKPLVVGRKLPAALAVTVRYTAPVLARSRREALVAMCSAGVRVAEVVTMEAAALVAAAVEEAQATPRLLCCRTAPRLATASTLAMATR